MERRSVCSRAWSHRRTGFRSRWRPMNVWRSAFTGSMHPLPRSGGHRMFNPFGGSGRMNPTRWPKKNVHKKGGSTTSF
eukprot:8735649-Pyramimonas_sp.AAC.1